MRTLALGLVVVFLLSGCTSSPAAPTAMAPDGSVVFETDGTNPTQTASGAPSSSSAPTVPGGTMHLAFTLSNASVPAGQPVQFALIATFRGADGNPVTASNPAWRVAKGAGASEIEVASGASLPASSGLTFDAAGTVRLVAYVRADGFVEQSVVATLTVTAAPQNATCQRADTLEPPTVRPAKDLGGGEGEPNIVVAPDGTLYITPISPLYRSTDDGATWQDMGAKISGTGDGDLSVGASGRLHWFGLGNGVPYQYSDDKATTFSAAKDLSDGSASDREWIDAGLDGAVYTSWRDNDGKIETRTSLDDGQTWGPRHTMGPDAVGGNIFHGVAPHTVYEPITSGYNIELYASKDDGTTWAKTHVASLAGNSLGDPLMIPSAIFAAGAQDCAGTLYVVYADLNGELPTQIEPRLGRYGVYITSSLDDGVSWSTPQMLSTPGHAALMAWVAAGGPGKVAVTWYENVHGVPSEDIPDQWNVMLWESVTADMASPQGIKVSLTSAPNHLGAVCTSGLLCVAGGDRSLLDYFEVTLDRQGQPVATWMSSTLGTGFTGLAVQGADVWFGGIASGTRLD